MQNNNETNTTVPYINLKHEATKLFIQNNIKSLENDKNEQSYFDQDVFDIDIIKQQYDSIEYQEKYDINH